MPQDGRDEGRVRPQFDGQESIPRTKARRNGTTTGTDRRTTLKIMGGITAGALGLGAGYLHWWNTNVEVPPADTIEEAADLLDSEDYDIALDEIEDGQYRVTASTDDLESRVLYEDGEPASKNVILDELEGDSGLLARGNYLLPLAREVHEYFGPFTAPFTDSDEQVTEYRFRLHGQGGYIEDTLDSDGIERYDELGGENDGDSTLYEFDAASYYEEHFVPESEIKPR